MTDALILVLTVAAGAASSFAAYRLGRMSAVKDIAALRNRTLTEDSLPEPGNNVTPFKPKTG